MQKLIFTFLFLCFSYSACAQQVVVPDEQLKESAKASEEWLNTIDKTRYRESWDKASNLFKSVMPKDGWVTVMERSRKPLGRVSSREMIDQRIAIDPPGLPQGEYMVMFYNTSFANKPTAYEIVTLRKEGGTWKVITYDRK